MPKLKMTDAEFEAMQHAADNLHASATDQLWNITKISSTPEWVKKNAEMVSRLLINAGEAFDALSACDVVRAARK